MSATSRCPECGQELSSDIPAGICPECLLKRGRESGPSAVESETAQYSPPSAHFDPPAAEELRPLFPTLEILELLGRGGMGAVYKARQPHLDRLVAVKILPPQVSEMPDFAERFTREARALARLNHPNIVTVYDFGQASGLYYFLMEYVDGADVRQLTRQGSLEPREALCVVRQICDALQYSHDHGVVHRDIKPENILVDRSGHVKIADFGLAKLLVNDPQLQTLTATQHVMGTPHYMAPEQTKGTHAVDHRADIYSLGVVFYEMLTGELPMGKFEPPSRKARIDVRLDEVVLRALENEPERRYQHASHVKSDVESITSTDPPGVNRPVNLTSSVDQHPAGSNVASLERKELAGRLLLVRRQLMDQVAKSLRPLFWGQILQMLLGVGVIALGVYCWAPSMDVPHRLVSGIVLHVYGLLMILAASVICTRIKRVDYSKPAREIRKQLDGVRYAYLWFGACLGLVWWLLWIPFTVAVGFDGIVYPPAFWTSLSVGAIGLALSALVYFRFMRSDQPSSAKWRAILAGESLRAAYLALDEVVVAEVE